MKTPSRPLSVVGPAAALLALFAAGSLVARVLAFPLPAFAVGLLLVLLGLRLGVMAAAVRAPPAAAPSRSVPGAVAHAPVLRAANG